MKCEDIITVIDGLVEKADRAKPRTGYDHSDFIEDARHELLKLRRALTIVSANPNRTIKPTRPSWDAAYSRYRVALQQCPAGSSLKVLYQWLVDNQTQVAAIDGRLPPNARAFAQYVRAYLKAKGLQSHREQKRIRRSQ